MNKLFRALVIDDDEIVRKSVSTVFRSEGWIVLEATANEILQGEVSWNECDLVICDAALAETSGLEIFSHQFAQQSRKTKFVLTTAHPNAAAALKAFAAGVYDYLPKPLDAKSLRTLSNGLRERLNAPAHTFLSNEQYSDSDSDLNLVGCSQPFLNVMKQIGRVAATNLPVFLTGESGTGKEIVASALHQRSSRSDGPFVAVNCGAIPAELIESELFGHAKGSFTGADRDRPGLWEEADGGTIFLDEVTETSLRFQVKLLRTLQNGEVRRVGSNQTQRLDVRVIAASNRDVEEEVRAGRFRQDLFYRLNAVSITLPPLRDRKEDIRLLTMTFVKRVAGKSKVRLTAEAFEVLYRYPWPGNIRELENTIVSSVATCDGIIGAQHLPERMRDFCDSESADTVRGGSGVSEMTEWSTLARVEADYTSRVLAHTRGNKQAAARLLEVDRKTLDRMIKRHKISLGNVASFPSRAA